jgi:3',5'-cyclic AMP phosphodiesterase CpdA
MARVHTLNFHNAKLSVAQSCIREHIAKRLPGAPASGLFAGHPILQAASAVMHRIYLGEFESSTVALAAYDAHRLAQKLQGMAVATEPSTPEVCLDLLARYVLAWVMDDTDRMNQIRSEWAFSPCNLLGWLEAVDAWLQYYWSGAAPQYNPPLDAAGQDQAPYTSPGTFDLPPASGGSGLVVGILGDWGTGELEAVAVVDQLMQQSPDVIIHVGDVYYAGTADEQASNFLDVINAARTKYDLNVPVYTLPGNHDYYCGGAPFYAMLPQLNAGVPDACTQTHSFWALVNDSWQLEGMDTGYYDSDLLDVAQDNTHLRSDEAAWHQQQLGNAGSRNVILFSHHQLFSTFEAIGSGFENQQLLANLQSWQNAAPNIVAWLWGHEHVLGVYQVPGSLPILGRCVGNSAFPQFLNSGYNVQADSGIPLLQAESSPGGGIPFPNGFVQTQPQDQVWASGYTVLNLPSTGAGTATYYQVTFTGDVSTATSQVIWQESVPATS